MADTNRSKTDLLALAAIGVAGGISAQDLRDIIESVLGAYGSIHIRAGSTAQAFASGVPEIMTGWTGNGLSNGTTPDEVTNKITVGVSGVYKCKFHCSFQGNNPIINQFRLYVDGVDASTGCHRKTTSTDVGSTGFEDDVALTAGQEVSVWFEGNGNSNFTALEASLLVHRIG